MVQAGQSARWGGKAALWGGLTGVAVAVIAIGGRLLAGGGGRVRAALTGVETGPLWLRALVVALAGVAFFLAGLFAARATRRVEAGIVAGLLAGAVSGALLALATLVSATAVGARLNERLGDRLSHAVVGTGIARAVLILLVATAIGTGLGALGGLLGRGRAGRPPQASAYPYEAPPQYPGYAQTPGQPQGWTVSTGFGAPDSADTMPETSSVYPAPMTPDDSGALPPV